MMSRLRLVLVAVLATLSPALASRAIADPIIGQTQLDGFFPAEAILIVQTPIGFDLTAGPNFGNPIYGGTFHTFTVSGNIRILSSNAQVSYVDPFSGPVGPVVAGENRVVEQEMVEVSDIMITSPTAGAGSLRLGDTVADFADSGIILDEPRSLFSTGGSAEIGPGFTSALGFMNLFLEVQRTQQ